MAPRMSSRVFVGRAAELAELVAALGRAADGAPSVVLVGGEAGMGKSRLLAELAARSGDSGARVLRGQCAELEEAAIPLLPFIDALGELPDTAVRVASMHADVFDLLERASVAAPVLLALEDLHWADQSTLDLVAYLARRWRDERVVLVATYRSDEVDLRAGLRRFLAELATAPTARRLELAPLTLAETRAQVAGIVGAPPPAELVRAVFERAEGNPFFAEELVAAASGGEARRLSPTLRDALLARIAVLDPEARAVVRAAAGGGREVHHAILAEAAGIAEPALSEALRTAVRHHVLMARGERFAFRHALLREVVSGELLPGERARLHATFAAALERCSDVAGGNAATVAAEIAHHWLEAGDRPRAFAASVRAGDEAERIGALAEAARHDRRALELWDSVDNPERLAGVDRATLLGRAADAPAWSGQPAEALRLVDAAIALVNPAAEPMRAARLHERRGMLLWQLGRGGVEEFEHAVDLIPAEPPSTERARALGGLGFILMLAGRPARSRDACESAVAVARAVGARAEEADALASLGDDLARLGDREAGLRSLRRSRTVASEAKDSDVVSRTAIPYSDILRRDGRLEEAIEVALAGAAEARRAGLEMREGFGRLNAAEAAFELGRWELVEQLVGDVFAHGPTGVTLAFAHHVAGTLACARGDLAAAEAHLTAHGDAVGGGPIPPDYYALEAEAELALWQRRPADAARAASGGVRLVTEDALRRVLFATLGLRAEADAAELARARRDVRATDAARERAAGFHAVARERAGAAGHPALEAAIEAERARADGSDDPALWDAAARAWERRPAPYSVAYARWREAEAALARRDRRAVTGPLRAAHATALALGAEGLRSELETLARRARITLTRTPGGDSVASAAAELGLTAREREVLERLALGRTNRQIADELVISIKTAGVHVSHILAKLGAANRVEAASVAHRLGLVP